MRMVGVVTMTEVTIDSIIFITFKVLSSTYSFMILNLCVFKLENLIYILEFYPFSLSLNDCSQIIDNKLKFLSKPRMMTGVLITPHVRRVRGERC